MGQCWSSRATGRMWKIVFCLASITALTGAQRSPVGVAKEEVFPTFPALTECPELEGVQTYKHPDSCHAYYQCVNGTFTVEECGHGLLYSGPQRVCYYHWGVNCEGRPADVVPHTDGRVCIYDNALLRSGECNNDYIKCKDAEQLTVNCLEGLVFNETLHACIYADQMLEFCNPEEVVGFSCPTDLPPGSFSAKFNPFPRFPIPGRDDSYIVCVGGYPRQNFCGEPSFFDPETLSCY